MSERPLYSDMGSAPVIASGTGGSTPPLHIILPQCYLLFTSCLTHEGRQSKIGISTQYLRFDSLSPCSDFNDRTCFLLLFAISAINTSLRMSGKNKGESKSEVHYSLVERPLYSSLLFPWAKQIFPRMYAKTHIAEQLPYKCRLGRV